MNHNKCTINKSNDHYLLYILCHLPQEAIFREILKRKETLYKQKVIAILNYEFILYHLFVAPAIKMNRSVRSPPGSVSLKSVAEQISSHIN